MANCLECIHYAMCYAIRPDRSDPGEVVLKPIGGECDGYRPEADDEVEKRLAYSMAQRELGRIEGIGIALDAERERVLRGAAFNLSCALDVLRGAGPGIMETRTREEVEAGKK